MNEPELGRGRFPANNYKKPPKNFKKMVCSECEREYLIKIGEGHKIFKTCNSECSKKRMARNRAVLAAKHRSSKKVVGLYLEYELYKKISLRANKKGMPVSRFIKMYLKETFK